MTRRDDGKTRALAASRTLNPRPEKVTDAAFAPGSFFDPADLVQVKYEMVRRSEIDGVPAATAAAAFGFSRQSLYTAKSALAGPGGGGIPRPRPGPKSGHKLTEEVVDLLEELLAADATLRPAGLAAALRQRTGISVHPRSAERALNRRRAARAARPGQPGQDEPKSG
jgi:transposase